MAIIREAEKKLSEIIGYGVKLEETYESGNIDITPHGLKMFIEQVLNVKGLISTQNRTRRIATARQAYCYLYRKYIPGSTYSLIGMSIGVDHTTALASCKRVKDLMSVNDELMISTIEKLESELKNRYDIKTNTHSVLGAV
jgi:chromosomal replication initiation ATPase DnaA